MRSSGSYFLHKGVATDPADGSMLILRPRPALLVFIATENKVGKVDLLNQLMIGKVLIAFTFITLLKVILFVANNICNILVGQIEKNKENIIYGLTSEISHHCVSILI